MGTLSGHVCSARTSAVDIESCTCHTQDPHVPNPTKVQLEVAGILAQAYYNVPCLALRSIPTSAQGCNAYRSTEWGLLLEILPMGTQKTLAATAQLVEQLTSGTCPTRNPA